MSNKILLSANNVSRLKSQLLSSKKSRNTVIKKKWMQYKYVGKWFYWRYTNLMENWKSFGYWFSSTLHLNRYGYIMIYKKL